MWGYPMRMRPLPQMVRFLCALLEGQTFQGLEHLPGLLDTLPVPDFEELEMLSKNLAIV